MAPTLYHLAVTVDHLSEVRIVAISEGSMIASASVRNAGRPAATLYQLFVSPSHRGQGIGTLMVDYAKSLAKAAGSLALSAVLERNGPMAFYAQIGFDPVHHEDGQTLISKRL